MDRFVFGIVLFFSRLPLGLLYFFSDMLYRINRLFIGYRKATVEDNLRRSFPEKNQEEIKEIRNLFFKNFFDYVVETLKLFSISEEKLKKRVRHVDHHLFAQCMEEGRNVILLSGHVFNWEWMSILALIIPQEKCHPVYRKVRSAFWENTMKHARNRFGNRALEAKEVVRNILQNKNDGNSVYMFLADQSPHFSGVNYGLKFLGQDTPSFIGYDRLTSRLDLAFIYCDMKKLKRGRYQVNYHRIYPDGENFEKYEVVNKFHHMLEETIRRNPDNWLWSHRKWKYDSALSQ